MTPLPRRLSTGKVLISLASTWTAVGCFVFDWNETHIYNPSWPPHAKFHNAQTMSLGVGLAGATLQQLWRRHDDLADARRAVDAARRAVDAAALTGTLYWLTQISALAYPGAKAVDPPDTGKFPQGRAAFPALALVALGLVLERRPLSQG